MAELNKVKRLIISGPTASGKSSLAIKLASKLNLEIINIDSVQVYKDYNIGSAKPDAKSQELIKHHLIDVISPSTEFNVFDYNNALKKKLTELDEKNISPLIVGGSTLYIKTFIEGISEIKNKDEIKLLRSELEKKETSQLYSELLSVDNEASKSINENDKFRIVRALELIKTFNQPLSKILKDNIDDSNKNNALILIVCRNREELHKRINVRTKLMIEMGLVDEAKSLLKKYDNTSKIFKTLGLKEAIMKINGEIDENGLLRELSKNTRRYAKRQMTFWRNEPKKNGWEVLNPKKFNCTTLEKINVNKTNFSQLIEYIDENMNSKPLSTDVMYIDGSYLE